jgi:flagellar hook assembly protein FlgD
VSKFNSYPNPFNTTTTIHFSISEQKEISIYVFDIMGRLVKTIVPRSLHNAGQYNYNWDGKNDNGIPVSSGIYFCKILINQNNSSEAKSLKMILLK